MATVDAVARLGVQESPNTRALEEAYDVWEEIWTEFETQHAGNLVAALVIEDSLAILLMHMEHLYGARLLTFEYDERLYTPPPQGAMNRYASV